MLAVCTCPSAVTVESVVRVGGHARQGPVRERKEGTPTTLTSSPPVSSLTASSPLVSSSVRTPVSDAAVPR